MKLPILEKMKHIQHADVRNVLKKMTLQQKIALCSGKDFWTTKAFPELGIQSIRFADGPHGLRVQKKHADMLGMRGALPATCFPAAVTSGSSWNRELLQEIGKAIGEEARDAGVSCVLGPSVNIKRSPLCGRSFEYFSEDPFLSGELGAAFVQGLQSTGVAACVKHFATNNQETARFYSNNSVDERALREIYVKPFEIIVKKAAPRAIMAAYPKLNGVFCSDNAWLLDTVLRKEWGFDGIVISDWGGMGDQCKALIAGCDISMPGGSSFWNKKVLSAIQCGHLAEEALDLCVERIISFSQKSVSCDTHSTGWGKQSTNNSHRASALRAAIEGAVLLKNEDAVLPLKAIEADTLLVGYFLKAPRYQGSGSSHIIPQQVDSFLKVFSAGTYMQGCRADGSTTEALLAKVKKAAAKAKTVIVFAGLLAQDESEGFDRKSLELPQGHTKMIFAAAEANANTIVVLMGGGVMALPWLSSVKSVLYVGLCGEAGALATYYLLTGRYTPSGHLAETWPRAVTDIPCVHHFGTKNVVYKESMYVGYRYYETVQKNVLFPFGYGLSYTHFLYSDLKVVFCKEKSAYKIACRIKNTGSYTGAEVVQLYVLAPQQSIHRPKKELKGFEKIMLEVGAEKEVDFFLYKNDFAFFSGDWTVLPGTYEIALGSSCQDIRLSKTIILDDAFKTDVSKRSMKSLFNFADLSQNERATDEAFAPHEMFSFESSLRELSCYSVFAKMLCVLFKIVLRISSGAKNKNDPVYRMAVAATLDNTLQGLCISSKGAFPPFLAKLLLYCANRKPVHSVR